MSVNLRTLIGPIIAFLAYWTLTHFGHVPTPAALTVAIIAWTATWWVLEPIPAGAVSLIPLALFPLLGILTHDQVAEAIGSKLTTSDPIQIAALGPWRSPEKRTLLAFLFVIIAWVTRTFPAGGWSSWFHLPNAWDSDVALLGVCLFLLIPDGAGGRLLTWEKAKRIPWDLLLLTSAGISISMAFSSSGLSAIFASQIGVLENFSNFTLILGLVVVTAFTTQLVNNTPTCALMMPLIGAASLHFHMNPLFPMLAAAFASSSAFMLPIATAPNAVVYGSGLVSVKTMATEGLRITMISIPLITLILWLYQRFL